MILVMLQLESELLKADWITSSQVSTLKPLLVGVSTGRARSVLCLTRTRSEFLGWVKIGTETDPYYWSGRLIRVHRFSGLCLSVSGFAAGAEISPDPARSGRYLAGSVESELDLDEVLPDLAGSVGLPSRSSSEGQKNRQYLSFFVGNPWNVVGCC